MTKTGSNSKDDVAPPKEERVFQVGQQVFGRFKVLARLGEGNMGQVYKVRDVNLDKVMALKVLHGHSRDQKAIIRFQNEAKTTSRLSHHAIATVYDFGLDEDGSPYLAMDFIEGRTLEGFIADGNALDLPQFLAIFADVCEALECAHRSGVVHRDIKPGNIMLIEENDGFFSPIVLDFGLAKSVDATEGGAQFTTGEGQIMGTPLYMSPEQTEGLNATSRSDLYSLGCVMFECLAGRPPFTGKTTIDTLLAHRTKEPPNLKELSKSAIPEELDRLISHLLEKKPNERPESAQSVHDRLVSILEAHHTAVEEASQTSKKQKDAEPLQFVATVRKDFFGKKPSKRFLIGVALLAVLAPLVVALWFANESQVFNRPTRSKAETIEVETIETQEREGNKNDLKNMIKDGQKDFPMHYLGLLKGGFKDDDLKIFQGYDKLESIEMETHPISDAGLRYLENLPRLRKINLSGTDVKTLDSLKNMPALQEVDLTETKITDASLKNLSKLNNLRVLKLTKTGITIAGIENLASAPNLVQIDVDVPLQLSIEDVKKFGKRHPACRFLGCFSLSFPLVQEARKCSQARKFKESLEIYEYVVEVQKHQKPIQYERLCQHLIHSGEIALAQKNIPLAKKFFLQASDYARQSDDCKLLINSAKRLALFYCIDADDVNGAEREGKRVFALLKERGDDRETRFQVSLFVGNISKIHKRLKEAKNWYALCVDAAVAPLDVFRARGNLGDCLRILDDYDAANKNFVKAANVYESIPERDKPWGEGVNFYTQYSDNTWRMKEYEKAVALSEKAIKNARHKGVPAYFLNLGLNEKYCYMTALGRKEEADAIAAEMKKVQALMKLSK